MLISRRRALAGLALLPFAPAALKPLLAPVPELTTAEIWAAVLEAEVIKPIMVAGMPVYPIFLHPSQLADLKDSNPQMQIEYGDELVGEIGTW